MDLKSQDLVWVEEKSTSWTHPGSLEDFSEIPGLAPVSDSLPVKARTILSQVSLPAHRLPPSEFDPPPTLALFATSGQLLHDKGIALQLTLFPSAVTCHPPGVSRAWREALQLERDFFNAPTSPSSGPSRVQGSFPGALAAIKLRTNQQRAERKQRRSTTAASPVICEFRRTTNLSPQYAVYQRPSGTDVVIRFIADDDIL